MGWVLRVQIGVTGLPLWGGYDSTRDNVLRSGEILDFETLSADTSTQIDDASRQSVGHFKVDFLEVMFYRMGVVMDSNYFGMGGGSSSAASHPLRKYDELSGFDDIYTMALFEEPGADVCQPDQTMNILFASNEWFTSPVRIWLSSNWDAALSRYVYSIGASSGSLTSTQSNIILSLVNQGTSRRSYSCFVIIPFQGPLVYDLNEADPEIRIQMQVQGALDPASVFDASSPSILFNTDSDGIPFHLSVDFGN